MIVFTRLLLNDTDADWATADEVILDENGDRQPDFWLWNLGSGSVYVPAMKIVYDLNNGNVFSVILHLYIFDSSLFRWYTSSLTYV